MLVVIDADVRVCLSEDSGQLRGLMRIETRERRERETPQATTDGVDDTDVITDRWTLRH